MREGFLEANITVVICMCTGKTDKEDMLLLEDPPLQIYGENKLETC